MVRGMGVADMTSTCGAPPLLQGQALAHAEAVLLVRHDQAQAAILHAAHDERVRSDDEVRLPRLDLSLIHI